MRQRQPSRWVLWGMCVLASLAVAATVSSLANWSPSAAVAQDEPDAGGGTPAPAPAAGAAQQSDESLLFFFWKSLGIWYTLAFLLMSFILVALIVMNLMALQKNTLMPPHLIDGFEALLNEKRYQEAYELSKTDESYLGQVLAAGLSKLSSGYDKSIGAMSQVADDENMKMEHRISYVALIGAIAPMVGLYGTVDGMIASFRVIATSITPPKPAQLAEGISTALVTTIVGLFIAIPAVISYAYLKNVVARLQFDGAATAGNLMSRFEGVDTKGK
jgi:biopolymer transport protein ExbB